MIDLMLAIGSLSVPVSFWIWLGIFLKRNV